MYRRRPSILRFVGAFDLRSSRWRLLILATPFRPRGITPPSAFPSIMMTPTPLRFESKDMLNSALVRPDGKVEYTTHTELDLYDHKRTTIKGRSGLRAIIDWTAKTFTIGGKERLWTQLKKNMGNPLSSKFRVWHWSDTRYTVRYAKDHDGEMRYTVRRTREDGKWEEKEEGAGADLARLSPVVVHFFNPPEPAVLSLAPELEEMEGIFLILVLLASETKRCDARSE
ncbi:hypothetical protein DFH06DRAFT_630010 [Mycena polygramma]|nr:hypothetical protein DFH06DRAFT_630010 [Mycena polygramma]